jgi:putative membrane protein
MKLYLLGLASLVLVSSCDKDDDDDQNQSPNSTDREFAMRAAMSNKAEVGAGALASNKADDDGIRDFGAMMVNDHTGALNDLREITNDLNLYAPDSLDAKHQALAQQLSSLQGREFDSVYIHSQVEDHQMAISLFENQANNGSNSRLVRYANDKLPTLRMHLEHADSLAGIFPR